MEKTLLRRIEQYKDRWSSFGDDTGIIELSDRLSARELQEFEIFSEYKEGFLEQISPDVSLALWEADSVLFEEGSYIDLAFYIVEGEVGVYLKKGEGGAETFVSPILGTDSGIESAADEVTGSEDTIFYERTQRLQSSSTLTFLATMDFDLPLGEMRTLGAGEFFGEIGSLNGWPMSVTAKTLTQCRLLQIRLPALRQLKRKSKVFKKRVDDIYRGRTLGRQLKAAPLFRGCSGETLSELASRVDLVSYEPGELVVREGEKVDSLYLVRSGFMKVSQRRGEGQSALSYVPKGMTFGEVELLLEGVDQWKFSVSSVGYSELVRIDASYLDRLFESSPGVRDQLWDNALARIKETGYSRRHPGQSEFIQFSLDKGLVEGNSILVIDLANCTRCDDCVRACADTHGGLPRFVREGDKYGNLLIAKACYHCQDPVCLIGCPTGAIRRSNVGHVVEIKEEICIGCSNCATQCPYDAIVMHDTGTAWGPDALPKALRGEQRMLASKCDLCYTSDAGPACVTSCPQGCAHRVGSVDEFRVLLGVED